MVIYAGATRALAVTTATSQEATIAMKQHRRGLFEFFSSAHFSCTGKIVTLKEHVGEE
jgi:hypothetical protein